MLDGPWHNRCEWLPEETRRWSQPVTEGRWKNFVSVHPTYADVERQKEAIYEGVKEMLTGVPILQDPWVQIFNWANRPNIPRHVPPSRQSIGVWVDEDERFAGEVARVRTRVGEDYFTEAYQIFRTEIGRRDCRNENHRIMARHYIVELLPSHFEHHQGMCIHHGQLYEHRHGREFVRTRVHTRLTRCDYCALELVAALEAEYWRWRIERSPPGSFEGLRRPCEPEYPPEAPGVGRHWWNR